MPAKKSTSKNSGPTLAQELRALDRKDRNFRNCLPEDQQKKFSTYLMLRYGASVAGSADLQAYYLLAANENVNKHFFDIGKHPQLQWLTCTTVSPGLGQFEHYWLGAQKKTDGVKHQDSLKKQVSAVKPNWKNDEVDLFVQINGADDIAAWLGEHGVEI